MNFLKSVINYFYEDSESEYSFIEPQKDPKVEVPDTPIFHFFKTILENIQLYVIDSIVLMLEQESINNTSIELLFFWFPSFLSFINVLWIYFQKIIDLLKVKFFHPLDRKGFLYLVGRNVVKAYEMTSNKFYNNFLYVHKDFKLSKTKMTVEQRKIFEFKLQSHKEALHFWMYHECLLRPVYFLVREIEMVQEWILFRAFDNPKQTDLIVLWKKWNKRKRKLEISIRNKIFDVHHQVLNKWISKIGFKETKPYEYYCFLYNQKIKKDKDMLSIGNIKMEEKTKNLSWIQKEIGHHINIKNNLFSFLKTEHHPDFILLISRENLSLHKNVQKFISIKRDIEFFRQKTYNLRKWYSYYVLRSEFILDFFEKWKSLNQELSEIYDQLDVSFLKQIKTLENKKKDVQTRFIQSIKNKIVRKTLKGIIWDETMNLDQFYDLYQSKKQSILNKITDLNNLCSFYKESGDLKASTLAKKKNWDIIDNHF